MAKKISTTQKTKKEISFTKGECEFLKEFADILLVRYPKIKKKLKNVKAHEKKMLEDHSKKLEVVIELMHKDPQSFFVDIKKENLAVYLDFFLAMFFETELKNTRMRKPILQKFIDRVLPFLPPQQVLPTKTPRKKKSK